ncbi:MAG: pitrilysin family protein [Bryobacteraceae bacterium]
MKRLALLFTLATAAFAQTAAPVGSYKQLVYPPLKEVRPPEPTEITLSNGMRVFLLENHELPILHGFAMVRTGNLFDPIDKRGLSQVMAEVMRSGGTKSKTGDQIDEDLENIAASVESNMGETSATVGFSGLKETGDQVLAVFKDVLTSPEFRQDKIDLSLNQFKGGIARRNDEAGEIPRRELLSLLYGRDNSYGWSIEYEHLNNIKRQDLVNFYQRYYFPKNIMLAVYGDFTVAEMRTKLESLFGTWKVEQPSVPAFPAVTAKPAPGIYFADKPDVTQTFFSLGHLGGTLKDKDYPALEVASNILGEGFKSRLMAQIRTKLGYAYSIGSTWAANYNFPGTFRIGGSTKSASTVETIQAIKVEIEKMRTTEVTPVELTEAKQSVLNSFVFFFDSPEKTLNRVMQYAYHGYPKDFLFQYQKAIESVTRADILRVAKQYIRPDELTIVAVGNTKEMPKPLSTLGTVNTLDLTIPQPKQQLAAADNASLARGKAMLQRAQQAMGGTDKLAAIKDSTVVLDMTMAPSQGGIKMKQTIRTVLPSHYRQDQVLPFGLVVAYINGDKGWLSTPQGTQDMPAEIVKQAQGEAFRNFPAIILSDRMAGRTVNAVNDNTVEISGGGETVRVEFDATGLPGKLLYRDAGANGAPTEVTETMSDFREVSGLKVPFKVTIQQGTEGIGQATMTSYAFNSGLTAEEIGKRP